MGKAGKNLESLSDQTPIISVSTLDGRSVQHYPESLRIVRNCSESSGVVRSRPEAFLVVGIFRSWPESLRVGVIPSRAESSAVARSRSESSGVVRNLLEYFVSKVNSGLLLMTPADSR